jgi:hypothetical protein
MISITIIQNKGNNAMSDLQKLVSEKKIESRFYPELNKFIREFIEENKLVDEYNAVNSNIEIPDEIDLNVNIIKKILYEYNLTLDYFDNNDEAPHGIDELIGASNYECHNAIKKIRDLLNYNERANFIFRHSKIYFGSIKYIEVNTGGCVINMYGLHIPINDDASNNAKLMTFKNIIVSGKYVILRN